MCHKILRAAGWNGRIISEVVDSNSALMNNPRRAFAAAAKLTAKGATVLQKPYGAKVLARRVRELLDDATVQELSHG